jgi:hypothetical protein
LPAATPASMMLSIGGRLPPESGIFVAPVIAIASLASNLRPGPNLFLSTSFGQSTPQLF